jgi:hypothetical protein
VTALTIPITFQNEAEAKHFVKRLVQALECPCMRRGTLILAVCLPENLDILTALAQNCKGTIGSPLERLQETE